jgi:hypothetical protein
MDIVEVAEAIGKKIIQTQNLYFEDSDSEDIEHITTLKRIIVAISEYLRLEDVPEDKISALADYFKQVTKQLYINACIMNKIKKRMGHWLERSQRFGLIIFMKTRSIRGDTRSWGKTMIFDNGKTKEYRENRKYL